MSVYKYPDIAEKPLTIFEQVMKMNEELDEVIDALKTGDRDQIGFETCNLEHTCETLLRMLSSDPKKIREWRQLTIDHNAARGYYSETLNGLITDGASYGGFGE